MNKILIVEDEDFLIKALKDNLIVEGFTIDTAKDGEEAVKMIGKNKPDLILLDLLMPKKDGFYVLEELKKNPKWKSIPVIVLSNLGDETTTKRAMEIGVKDYLEKSRHPIEEVIKKVKEYLKK
ncbi:MAG: two-component system, OmpR family, alkaline phosphatase synthesis response regulator PhoP [Parcubacteria group bacterium Licking1014_1]|nr:MAG: two-component system, OmpR family, alkaline phosphatase synthesis response regulator PhoP [Parcubacteria group bacterium Licking1014_1]